MIFLSVYAVFALFSIFCIWGVFRSERPISGVLPLGVHLFSVFAIFLAATTNGIVHDANLHLTDLMIAFSAIGKAADGTQSSIDYFNPIGPVYEWGFRTALLFRPPSAATLPMANALIAALVLAATIVMLRRRVSPLAIALVGLIAVTTAASPRDLDALFVAGEASFLAPYNRWGWALFVPVIFLFAAPARTRDWTGPSLAGALIALMLLLKPTYGLAALGMAAITAVLLPGRCRDGVAAVAGTLVTLFVLEVLTGQVTSYVADLVEAARMQQGNYARAVKMLTQTGNFVVISGCALLLLYMLWPLGEQRLQPQSSFRIVTILILATGCASWAVLSQNHDISEAAAYALMPVLAAEWTGFFESRTDRIKLPANTNVGLMLLAIFMSAGTAVQNAGFILAQKIQTERLAGTPEISQNQMANLFIPARRLGPPCTSQTCMFYTEMVSGKQLIEDVIGAPSGPILALSVTNPFPFLFGQLTPSGAPIWLDMGRSISIDHHPPATKIFAGVDILMVRRAGRGKSALASLYAKDIKQDFEERASNQHWHLYTRRP